MDSPGQNTGVGSLNFPFPGDLPNPGIEPGSPALQVDSLPVELPGKPKTHWKVINILNMCASSIQIDKIIFKKCKHHSLKKTFPDDVLLTPNSRSLSSVLQEHTVHKLYYSPYHINYNPFFSPQFSPTKCLKLPGLPSLFLVLTYKHNTE